MRARHRSRVEPEPPNIPALAFALLGAALLYAAGVSRAHSQAAAPAAPSLQAPRPEASEPKPALPSTGENLSERLDRSGGVIRPPAGVDPEIRVPPKEPNAGTMPVIPPPGSPGGNPSVQPK